MATKAKNTKKAVKATSTISLPKAPSKTASKVTNSTLPKTAGKKPAAKPAKPAPQQSSVATLAPQKAQNPQQKTQAYVNKKGALVPAIVNIFTNAVNNATPLLINKTITATLYHTFVAYNGSTNMAAIGNMHSCLPAHFYKRGATIGCINSFVNDANKGAHYACSAFKTIYSAQYKPAHVKAYSALLLSQATINPLLQAWAVHFGYKSFKVKAFWQHVSKLSA